MNSRATFYKVHLRGLKFESTKVDVVRISARLQSQRGQVDGNRLGDLWVKIRPNGEGEQKGPSLRCGEGFRERSLGLTPIPIKDRGLQSSVFTIRIDSNHA
jgi:hypothetical protein